MHEFYLDRANLIPFVKPWVVVTKDGVVVDRFEEQQAQAAHSSALRLAGAGNTTVSVYAVDSRIIPSPTPGDISDGEISGWVLLTSP